MTVLVFFIWKYVALYNDAGARDLVSTPERFLARFCWYDVPQHTDSAKRLER